MAPMLLWLTDSSVDRMKVSISIRDRLHYVSQGTELASSV